MISVTFFKENGNVVKVSAQGHSGLAESGSDILCAAVSALVQTAYIAIKDISDCVEYSRDGKNGKFVITVRRLGDMHDADVILRALYVGLTDLESGYPQNLKIEEKSICL